MAGYRAQEAAVYAVAGHYPVNVTDPRLEATMTGAELGVVRNRLTVANLQHQYLVGTADLAPVILEVTGTTAIINDCQFDHSRVVDANTGKTISGPQTQRTLQKVTLQFDAGTWKVIGFQKVGVGCVPAV